MSDDLWSCPDCGRRFVNVHQWHSCGNPALSELLDDASPVAREIYDAIEAAIATVGEFRVHPQKTRIAFVSRMTFASVRLARRWVDLGLIVDVPIDDPRIRRLDLYGPTSFGHELRLDDAGAVDDDVRRWLARARTRGDQSTLDRGAHVDPVVGRALERLRVPLRTSVVEHAGELGLALPRYATEAFDAHRRVVARIGGAHHGGLVEPAGERGVLFLDSGVGALGLGLGDSTDAFVTAEL